jgi:hypothetical protein
MSLKLTPLYTMANESINRCVIFTLNVMRINKNQFKRKGKNETEWYHGEYKDGQYIER